MKNNEVINNTKKYLETINQDPIGFDYVDRLESLCKRWLKSNIKGINECGQQIKELIPNLKIYQEYYRQNKEQEKITQEICKAYLFGGECCKECGCRSCMCYLNEPG